VGTLSGSASQHTDRALRSPWPPRAPTGNNPAFAWGWSATITGWVRQATSYVVVLLVAVRLDDIKQRCAAMAIRNINCNNQERARHQAAGWRYGSLRPNRGSTTGRDTVG
jgi:hypothetical protein